MRQESTKRSLTQREIESIRRIQDKIKRLCLHFCLSTENQEQELSNLKGQLEEAVLTNNFETFNRISIEIRAYKVVTDEQIQLTQNTILSLAHALYKVVDCFSNKESFPFLKELPSQSMQKSIKKRARPSSTGETDESASPIINSFLESFSGTPVSGESTSESDTDSSTTVERTAKRQKTSNTGVNPAGIFGESKAGTPGNLAAEVIPMVTMG